MFKDSKIVEVHSAIVALKELGGMPEGDAKDCLAALHDSAPTSPSRRCP